MPTSPPLTRSISTTSGGHIRLSGARTRTAMISPCRSRMGAVVATPPVPDYPSAHAAAGGAASAVLISFFGDEHTFTLTSTFPVPPRTFNRISDAAKENSISRMLVGIHFRLACTRVTSRDWQSANGRCSTSGRNRSRLIESQRVKQHSHIWLCCFVVGWLRSSAGSGCYDRFCVFVSNLEEPARKRTTGSGNHPLNSRSA